MKNLNNLKGISCVCGAFLIQFSLGTLYTFGNMSPYIASYLRFKTDNTWVTTGDTVWILSGSLFVMGCLMVVGGLMDKRCGSRITCLFGSWTMSICVIFTYFTIKKNLILVIITYGLGFGFGMGISYTVALTAAMKWYPLQRGMISGIVVGGYGLGSFLFNLVQTKIINPLNIPPRSYNVSLNSGNQSLSASNFSLSLNSSSNTSILAQEKYFFDESILNRVPICFVITGVSYAAIQLIGVLLLMDYDSNHLKEVHTEKNGDKLDQKSFLSEDSNIKEKDVALVNGSSSKEAESEILPVDFTTIRALKNPMFWILWVTFFLNGLVIVTISAVYKSFGQQFISDDQYFAILGAVGGICNCGGRVVWGRLNDLFHYRIVMSALTILMASTMGTFYFTSFINSILATKIIYFIYGSLLFISLSGTFAILPSATAECFGTTNLSMIYGVMFTALATASITGGMVSSFLFHVLQFRGQFVISTVVSIISLILTQFYRPQLEKRKPESVPLTEPNDAKV